MDFINDNSPEYSDEIDSDVEFALYSQIHYNVYENDASNKINTTLPIQNTTKIKNVKNINKEQKTSDTDSKEEKFAVLMDFLQNSKNSLLDGCIEPKPISPVIDLTKSDSDSDFSDVEKWQIIDSEFEPVNEEKSLKLHVSDNLQSKTKENNEWSVIEQDTQDLSNKEGANRYFVNSRIRCKNCDEAGHIAVMCPQPKKAKTCHLCAQKGHLGRYCPKYVSLPFRYPDIECDRCNQCGHIQSECPELWRQYHLTIRSGHIKAKEIEEYKTKKICCFSCKKKSHFGFDCPKLKTWYPYSMFITRYDHWVYITKPENYNNNNKQINGKTLNKDDPNTEMTSREKNGLKRKKTKNNSKRLPEKKKIEKVQKVENNINKKSKQINDDNNSKVSYKNANLEITFANNNNKKKPKKRRNNNNLPQNLNKNSTFLDTNNHRSNIKNRKRNVEVISTDNNLRNVAPKTKKKKINKKRIIEAQKIVKFDRFMYPHEF